MLVIDEATIQALSYGIVRGLYRHPFASHQSLHRRLNPSFGSSANPKRSESSKAACQWTPPLILCQFRSTYFVLVLLLQSRTTEVYSAGGGVAHNGAFRN